MTAITYPVWITPHWPFSHSDARVCAALCQRALGRPLDWDSLTLVRDHYPFTTHNGYELWWASVNLIPRTPGGDHGRQAEQGHPGGQAPRGEQGRQGQGQVTGR